MDTSRLPLTVPSIAACKGRRKLSALTAYDFTFAKLFDEAGIDILLVGDSLGCVIQGHSTTLPVTLDEMLYHCRCVRRGVQRALVVGDLPFMTYQASDEAALEAAGRLIKDAGVSAVKLEGGLSVADRISALTRYDIPVMGHVGLTPQSYHRMGGHRIQGRSVEGGTSRFTASAEKVRADAHAVEDSGAFAVVLEGIPEDLAREITEELTIPTIGIACGSVCDGQILVSYDLLNLTAGKVPRFVSPKADLKESITRAAQEFIAEISADDRARRAS